MLYLIEFIAYFVFVDTNIAAMAAGEQFNSTKGVEVSTNGGIWFKILDFFIFFGKILRG
jgi:hypothetical protein